ncbi:MAG: hypothetical protein OEV37_01055 [Candidatus Berkelbacteria bacterium]|nr:hypothetical protein [Candidatus Berkelbacteria bacterium]
MDVKSVTSLIKKRLGRILALVIALALLVSISIFSHKDIGAEAITIPNGTYISAKNFTYDYSDVVIKNADVTIDGYHYFKKLTIGNGGTLTQSPAGIYRKNTRSLDYYGFVSRSWAFHAEGLFDPAATKHYKFKITDADDAVLFRINTETCLNDPLGCGSGNAYSWVRASKSSAAAIAAGWPANKVTSNYVSLDQTKNYQIELFFAQANVTYGTNNAASFRLKYCMSDTGLPADCDEDAEFNDLNTSTMIKDRDGTASQLDLSFYVGGSGADVVGLDKDPQGASPDSTDVFFDFTNATSMVHVSSYNLFSAKAYFPKSLTASGQAYRSYTSSGYLSTNSSDNMEDIYPINRAYSDEKGVATAAATNHYFQFDFSSYHSGDNIGYTNPLGYLPLKQARDTGSFDYKSYWGAFYSLVVLNALRNLVPLEIEAETLEILNEGKIDLTGKGYSGGRWHYRKFYESAYGVTGAPSSSGFGPGGGQGYYAGSNQQSAGGGHGGVGGGHNLTVNEGLKSVGGKDYGEASNPLIPGSGGGLGFYNSDTSDIRVGGNGGGQVKIWARSMKLVGSAKIIADGTLGNGLHLNYSGYDLPDSWIGGGNRNCTTGCQSYGGGGAGGAIQIKAAVELVIGNWDIYDDSPRGGIFAEGASSLSLGNVPDFAGGDGGGGGRIRFAVPTEGSRSTLQDEVNSASSDIRASRRCPTGVTSRCGTNGTVRIAHEAPDAFFTGLTKKNTIERIAYTNSSRGEAAKDFNFQAGEKVFVRLGVLATGNTTEVVSLVEEVSRISGSITVTPTNKYTLAGGTQGALGWTSADVGNMKVVTMTLKDGLRNGVNYIDYEYTVGE